MAIDKFTVVALPFSRAEADPFHVSLFVSPELTPDAPNDPLSAFPRWLKWSRRLPEARITLFNQAGEIASTPLLDDLDPDAWEAIFGPETPVRGRTLVDWSNRHWRTFRAATVHDTSKVLSYLSMATSPTSLPVPDVERDLMTRFMLPLLSQRDGPYDESVFTEIWDNALGEHLALVDPHPLESIKKRIEGAQPFEKTMLELHRVRRFYERPEGQIEYERRPIETAVRPELPRPEPDFHERLSLLGDHPGLLRRLGVVIDIHVDDMVSLVSSQFLRAEIEPTEGSISQSPETGVRVVGTHMVPTTADASEWSLGRLRLGNEDLFRVLDMDADGSALKTERFLLTVPRLLNVQRSSADATTATPAHRTAGFTIVHNERALNTQSRMESQRNLRTALANSTVTRLNAEDVTQGIRLEVWDDTTKEWYTLHGRRVDAEVLDHGTVLVDVPDQGFTQSTTASETPGVENSPVHIHEAVTSWGGWSLSAPRPGKRVRHDNATGEEVVEDTAVPPDPVTPIVITSKVDPGSLPSLRYGRSYAFRAWGVDLAGNSRPHVLGPVSPPTASVTAEITSALSTARPLTLQAPGLLPVVRSEASAVVVGRRAEAASRTPLPELDPAQPQALRLDGAEGVPIGAGVLSRLRQRRTMPVTRMGLANEVADVGRATLVNRAFEDLVIDTDRAIVAVSASRNIDAIAGSLLPGDTVDEGLDTVTALHPFLRWEPVQPPVVVARHPNSPGESLLQIVIRSGVSQDPETLEITTSSPEDYAAANPGFFYRGTSERHFAPPKTSQSEAELHGSFDTAIGSTDPAEHAAVLGAIIRESGTLFDIDVARLDDPNTRDPQPGIALVADPGAPPSTFKTLPLPQGDMPASGQYVIHDVDDLNLPYLPDPLGQGISLVFQDAGRDRTLVFPFGAEGFTAPYLGSWPALEPFRFVLTGTPELTGNLDGRTLTMGLPAGDMQRFRLSSSMQRADLDLFGFWRLLPAAFRALPEIAEAAADGWLWALTPFDGITLVHAVPRPLEAPRSTTMAVLRVKGSNESGLIGALDIHGPSTEQVTALARWTEYTDDLSAPQWEAAALNGVGFISTIRTDEDLAVLYAGIANDAQVQIPGFGPLWLHRAVHKWGDTKHREVTYQFRASTRFREYFDPETLAPDPTDPLDDGQSVLGEPFTVHVPSAARPAAPIIHSVLPLLRWDRGTEPEQPVAIRRARRAGVRIYLERPWFSSGQGELLGVLLAPASDVGLEEHVSQWGQDPIWRSTPIPRRAMGLELDSLLHASGLDDRPGDAAPVTAPTAVGFPDIKGNPDITVLGYQPQFNKDRGLWYVDIAVDPGDRFWPFVRLAVARYQPHSLPGCELSKSVRCDFVQLLPERTASVSRTDVRHVRVVVSGPVGTRGGGANETFPPGLLELPAAVRRNRVMIARLERADPNIPTDLGWETMHTIELKVRGTGRSNAEAAWVGELESPVDVPLQRPGDQPDWRVSIEEWEILEGDSPIGPVGIKPPPLSKMRRLVYLEQLTL